MLYIGGRFTSVNDYPIANHIAGYAPKDDDWWVLGPDTENGVDGTVWALDFMGSYLCQGGTFDKWLTPGGPSVKNISCTDIKSPYPLFDLGGGLNSTVSGLLVVGSDLYAAGHFTKANPGAVNQVDVKYIARWNKSTKTWYALGSGLDSDGIGMSAKGKDVYVGGIFQTAGGKPSLNIARWMGP